ncbi:MAG: diacylglycerol kinase [Candidatus Tyloplasma litorale]|nr:MAG: diacylglycerol kinase [Mycoplasmatales bacterium]
MINWFKRTSKKFINAMKGMLVMIREEKSLWVHFFATIFVIIMGIVFDIEAYEWIAIIFSIVLVIGFEIINTAIEYIVDIVSFEYNVKAKKVKDVAAMATLVVTIGAIIIGLIIFLPKISELFA